LVFDGWQRAYGDGSLGRRNVEILGEFERARRKKLGVIWEEKKRWKTEGKI
jgi:hypothetical protein